MDPIKYKNFCSKFTDPCYPLDKIEKKIKKYPEILRHPDTFPLLITSKERGIIEKLELFLKNGLDINRECVIRENYIIENCFDYACFFGETEMVKIMFPFLRNLGKSVIITFECGHTDIMLFFLDNLTEKNSFKDNYIIFRDAFEYLCINYEQERDNDMIEQTIKFFLEEIDKRKLEYKEDFFPRGLCHALYFVNVDILMQIFIKCNPSFNLGEDFYDDLLIYSIFENKRHDFLKMVIEYFDLNLTGRNGYNSLTYLCQNIYDEFPESLFEKIVKNCNFKTENIYGCDAEYYLRKNNKENFLKIIEKYSF